MGVGVCVCGCVSVCVRAGVCVCVCARTCALLLLHSNACSSTHTCYCYCHCTLHTGVIHCQPTHHPVAAAAAVTAAATPANAVPATAAAAFFLCALLLESSDPPAAYTSVGPFPLAEYAPYPAQGYVWNAAATGAEVGGAASAATTWFGTVPLLLLPPALADDATARARANVAPQVCVPSDEVFGFSCNCGNCGCRSPQLWRLLLPLLLLLCHDVAGCCTEL